MLERCFLLLTAFALRPLDALCSFSENCSPLESLGVGCTFPRTDGCSSYCRLHHSRDMCKMETLCPDSCHITRRTLQGGETGETYIHFRGVTWDWKGNIKSDENATIGFAQLVFRRN
eukprot:GEMP01051628.1.p1 GENE.GEMP01051628.1~~GEMP01051628.1.p1  ORF type:complete len:117 (-),score=1.79 GEMP01051628.1:302-652(-)